MVKSQRKIVREEDKLGYFEDTALSNAKEETVSMRFNNDLLMTRSYVDSSSRTAPVEPKYTPVVPAPQEPEVEHKLKKTSRPADYVPPVITRKPAAQIEEETDIESVSAKKEKTLTPTMKKALIAYLSIIFAVTVAIITTGIMINSMTADIAGHEAARASLSQTIVMQEAELESLSDPEVMAELAESLGMKTPGDYVTSDRVSVNEPPTDNDSNWFDAFGDYIGGLLGG